MKQITFSDMEYGNRKRTTKREEFLDIMEEIIPWEEWAEYVRPYYPEGKRGRPTKGIESVFKQISDLLRDKSALLWAFTLCYGDNLMGFMLHFRLLN